MQIIPYIESETDSLPERATKVVINSHNWSDSYPYAPEITAYLWHNNKSIYIEYIVDENHVTACVDQDNGKVHNDSCVEFFISFGTPGYYNIEANCIGKILFSHRIGRKIDVEYASQEILDSIIRNSSLGSMPFSCRKADGKWSLRLQIPVNVFFKDNIDSLSGKEAKCNFYKCGDNLPYPHFMSWQPVETPEPDFHRPEFFGSIKFE